MAHSQEYHEEHYATTPPPPRTTTSRGAAHEEPRTKEKATTGISATEALAGGGAAVLAILGLLDIFPLYMAGIATLAVGAALVFDGAAAASRLGRDRRDAGRGGGGVSAEMLGGATGIALGVLALLGYYPWLLMPVAAIVYGASLLIGAGAGQNVEKSGDTTRGARVLVGLGASVLGILILADIADPVVLTLVSMLALGTALFLFGSTLGAIMGKSARKKTTRQEPRTTAPTTTH